MQYRPLRELFLARTRQFFREPETIFWVYFFPLLMMAGLGIAFRDGGEPEVRVRIAADRPEELARMRTALEDEPGVGVVTCQLEELESAGNRQEWDLTAVRIEGSFDYRFDPARAESHLAWRRVNALLQTAWGRQDAVPARQSFVSAPGSRYVDWLIPGLMGLNLMGSGLWGVGFVAVDMRIRKLLKRFRSTPMRRRDFLLSLVGGRLLFLVPEMATILLVGHFAFDLRIAGDLGSIFLIGFIGAATFAGLGLLIACRARKLETISGLMNLAMFPMWVLSGVFFAASRFPEAVQPVVQALPLTQLNHALRGVILHGHAFWEEWPALLILLAWGGLSFPLALRWFRWQ